MIDNGRQSREIHQINSSLVELRSMSSQGINLFWGLWGPLAHCLIDLNHGAGGTLLVDQGGHGPKGGGPCLGHHQLDFNSRGAVLMKTRPVVDINCRTHQ